MFHNVTFQELLKALSSTRMNSATGKDRTRWSIVAALLNDISDCLCAIYSPLLHHWIHPNPRKKAKYILIPKPEKNDKIVAKHYRPISLLCRFGKTMQRIMGK